MCEFVFRRNDGKKFVMHNIPVDMSEAIWNSLNEYCAMFENETCKIVSVIQREV